ncbi:reductase [Pseudonocardia sp. CA-107938]|uniref:reductase n=1 Tax=Pseudonocardia sp. CA-107938 TaxID=3240021 RepID=UPI003D91F8C3
MPRHVLRTARALADATPTYAFVSTTAVYRSWEAPGQDESAPTWPGRADQEGDASDLAKLAVHKRGCELAVEQVFGDAALVARAGSIVGPHDNLGQLPAWLARAAAGGRMVAPGDPGRGLQLIDARDLAAFVLDQVEAKAGGLHNAVADGPNTTMGGLVDACVQATGASADPVWIDEAFLLSHGAAPWTELPFWIPDAPTTAGFWAVSGAQARAAGLRTRPFAETVQDTWEWLRSGGEVRPAPGSPSFGLPAEKERRLLDEWAAAAELR